MLGSKPSKARYGNACCYSAIESSKSSGSILQLQLEARRVECARICLLLRTLLSTLRIIMPLCLSLTIRALLLLEIHDILTCLR